MSQKFQENGYKIIQDITQDVKEMTNEIINFPSEVKIQHSELFIGPNGWGGSTYFVKLTYNIDGVEYNREEQIFVSLNTTLQYVLKEIKDFYERMHKIK